MSTFPPGARVERCGSPASSLVKDGARGVVRGAPLLADNGTPGYFVRFPATRDGEDGPVIFCAGSRLRAVSK